MFQDKIHQMCTHFGIREKEIPKVLIYTKGLMYVPLIGLFGISYRYRPIKTFMKSTTGLRLSSHIKQKYPEKYKKIETFVQSKIAKIASSKIIMKIPNTLGMKSLHFTEAFFESIILNKCIVPVTLPLTFMTSIYFVKHNRQNDSDN